MVVCPVLRSRIAVLRAQVYNPLPGRQRDGLVQRGLSADMKPLSVPPPSRRRINAIRWAAKPSLPKGSKE